MRVPLPIAVAVIASANFAAFVAQMLDKARAKSGQWRLRESTLLLMGLPFAAAGMLAGMTMFRHKTRKMPFLLGAALVVLFNLGLAVATIWTVAQGHVAVE